MFMQLGVLFVIHHYINLLSYYYFDSAVVSTPQLHKHSTLYAMLCDQFRNFIIPNIADNFDKI